MASGISQWVATNNTEATSTFRARAIRYARNMMQAPGSMTFGTSSASPGFEDPRTVSALSGIRTASTRARIRTSRALRSMAGCKVICQ